MKKISTESFLIFFGDGRMQICEKYTCSDINVLFYKNQ